MQNFDEFFFHSKHASKSETIENLRTALIAEYLIDTTSGKLFKSPSPQFFTFQDFNSWFFQKTSQIAVSPEPKKLWSLISKGDELVEEWKFDDFMRIYAELLLEKHEKSLKLRRKNQKISKLKRRTIKYLESLENLLKEFGYKGQIKANRLVDQKCSFLITFDTLEIGNLFKDQDYLGHHIELGYGNSVVFTPTEQTNGRIVSFRKIQLSINLDFMTGTVFLNAYEDFLRENRIDKILVARRNLDLFSSLSRAFIAKVLFRELKDEALFNKFALMFEELAFEEDEKDEGHFQRENNIRLLKEEGRVDDPNQNASCNFTQEVLENETMTEKFKLCKTSTAFTNPYVHLRLYIACDNLKSLDDLGQFKDLMELRKEFLCQKADKSMKKIRFYRNLLSSLSLPLRGVILMDNEIRIDRKYLKSSAQSMIEGSINAQKRSCQIY